MKRNYKKTSEQKNKEFDNSVQSVLKWLNLPKNEMASRASELLPSFAHSDIPVPLDIIPDILYLSPDTITSNEKLLNENT